MLNNVSLSLQKEKKGFLRSIPHCYIAGDKIDIEEDDELILDCANDDLNYDKAGDGNIINEIVEPAIPFCGIILYGFNLQKMAREINRTFLIPNFVAISAKF